MKNRDALRALKIDQQLWAIHPAALAQLSAKMEHEAWLEEDAEDDKKPIAPQSILRVEDGIGTIPISGTLMSENNWLFPFFGDTSYESIQRAAQEAKTREDVQVVKTLTGSPGGLVVGAHDTSDAIRELAQVKPVVGYNVNMMTSAAYWINAHATHIVSAPTSFSGSCGVATVHREISGLEKKMGIKSTDIASGDLKKIGSFYEPLPEEARAYLQQQCVDCAQVFLDDADAGRKFTPEHKAEIARAGTYLGAQALSMGLVDSVGLTPHLNTIVNTLRESKRTLVDLGQNSNTQGGPTMATPEELQAAAGAERKRITDIMALAPAGAKAFAEMLAFSPDAYSVEQAGRILEALKANPPTSTEAPKAVEPPAPAANTAATQLNQFLGEAPAPLVVPNRDPATAQKSEGEQLMIDAATRRNAERRARSGAPAGLR